jgi:hypothetical protein
MVIVIMIWIFLWLKYGLYKNNFKYCWYIYIYNLKSYLYINRGSESIEKFLIDISIKSVELYLLVI